MIVKSITADAGGVGVPEDVLFSVDRIELLGYPGITKSIITDIPSDNVMVNLNTRIYAGHIRIKGIMSIPPSQQQQQINFLISPTGSGTRPWEVSIIGNKSRNGNLIERTDFDCQFMLPPATIGLRRNGLISRMFPSSCTSESSQMNQNTQQSVLTRDGKDVVI